MKPIGGSKYLAITQAGVRRDVRKMFEQMRDELTGLITRQADHQGVIEPRRESEVLRQAGTIVMRYFVGSDGRHPFADDGVTAVAAYPRILNKWLVTVTRQVVYSQRNWMKHNLPDDVYGWLSTVKSRSATVAESGDAERAAFLKRVNNLRMFQGNPLATYDAPHTWVDPNGYRLSDRIWQTGIKARTQIDRLLTDGIRNGTGSYDLSRQLEDYLLPGRKLRRTDKPYGRDASLDAMRLARTEIAHAHAESTLAASLANPYVEEMDVVRSAAGDSSCPICPEHATIDIDGTRVRDPYPIDEVDPPPYHPHDMCNLQAVVSATSDEVTAQLRDAMDEAYDLGIDPYLTPAQPHDFLISLLGPVLSGYFIQRVTQ